MNYPLVSIVMPTYNRRAYIARAIENIQAQTFRNFELIVVDDGSNDDTGKIVSGYVTGDQRIKFIRREVNQGAQAARNSGMHVATGEWIAFQDSDDEWLPQSLEARLVVATGNKADAVYSDCIIGSTGNLMGISPLRGRIYKELLRKPGPMFQSLLVRASLLKQIGELDEEILSYQEWDTSIRLAKHGTFGFVGEPTFIYHQEGQETISSDALRSARGYEQVIRKHAGEMRKLLGVMGMARHHTRAAYYYVRAGAYRLAVDHIIGAMRPPSVGAPEI